MPAEEPHLKGLPPPGPCRVEGGAQEADGKETAELQCFRTDDNTRGKVHDV